MRFESGSSALPLEYGIPPPATIPAILLGFARRIQAVDQSDQSALLERVARARSLFGGTPPRISRSGLRPSSGSGSLDDPNAGLVAAA